MSEWSVTMTQTAPGWHEAPGARRWHMVVRALDAHDARRRAQKLNPGWTVVIVERRP